eukprot:366373-Chlamydomonas_euryale.AAC.3
MVTPGAATHNRNLHSLTLHNVGVRVNLKLSTGVPSAASTGLPLAPSHTAPQTSIHQHLDTNVFFMVADTHPPTRTHPHSAHAENTDAR